MGDTGRAIGTKAFLTLVNFSSGRPNRAELLGLSADGTSVLRPVLGGIRCV
jgi:hypothetical protein